MDVVTRLDDTITAEVIRNALAVAVEEASIVVVRSSHSTWIQEGADAAGALLDADGQLVAQSTATSLMHGASLRTSLPYLLEVYPASDMRPGDVYALNDPYKGGIHANDILVFRPIFADGAVAYLAGTLIHVADVGGVSVAGLAALANDTFAEGLLLPPVQLYREGIAQRDVLGIIERNSRSPGKVIGDVHALVAGTAVVARRIEELIERYGAEQLSRFVADHLDYTERRVREELVKVPDGTYYGGFLIDSDGVDPSRTYEVRAAVEVAGGQVNIDFTGTSPQSTGSINSSRSQTLSGVIYAVRCVMDPTIPMNEGCFRPVHVHLPEGTLVNPFAPAACGGRVVTVAAAVDAILDAFATARPDLAVAASGLIHVFTLTGLGSDGQRWLNMFYEFGGIGARQGSDGPDATGCFFLGGRSVIPQIEPLEAQYPFIAETSRLRPDSGGPGEWRGGLGVELRLRMLSDAELTVRGDRMGVAPPGRQSGRSGVGGSFLVERANGVLEQLAHKQTQIPLMAGDVFIMRTSGGGGLGVSADRQPDLVRRDVIEGRVSAEGAERDYGVLQ
jgi:N-methylhydantoinase B